MIKVKNMSYLINSIIGIALMFGIPLIPPIEPLTKIGMQLGGIFIGLVYLWSTVDLLWPCLLGIIALAFTDYVDFYGILPAFADYTPLFMLFSMMFGGAVASCGLTAYIAHWFLSLKIINGRPDVFNFIIMLAMYIVSGFFDPLMAMLILWPTLYSIFKEAGYKPGDAYTRILIIATFIAITLGQGILPFFGAQLIILSAFQAASGITVNYMIYITLQMLISIVILLVITLLIKFILRPDMNKMKNISAEKIHAKPLPPMNITQKSFATIFVIMIIFGLIPSILPAESIIVSFIDHLSLLGFLLLILAILSALQIKGTPVIDLRETAKENVMWDLYLLVVLAIFFSGNLLADATGIKPWLIQLLMPIFGNFGPVFFIVFLLIIGILLTNIANNAIVGAIFVQILTAMAPSLGIENPAPMAIILTMVMFLAVLTPAASPYAAVLHANKEWVSMNDILKYGSLMLLVSLIVFVIVGLPLANLLY